MISRRRPDATSASSGDRDFQDLRRGMPFDFARAINNGGDALIAYDREWRYVFLNPAAELLIQRDKRELLGKVVWEVYPLAVGTLSHEMHLQAVTEGQPTSYSAFVERLNCWFDVCCYPHADGLFVWFRDITDFIVAEEKAREANRRALRLLDAVGDGFFTLDRDFRVIYANAEAVRRNGKRAEEFEGKTCWEEWPGSVGTEIEERFRFAMTERTPVVFEHHYGVAGTYYVWLHIRVYPDDEGGGLYIVFSDITKRVEKERRAQFLITLAERAHPLADDPDAVIADTVRSVAECLGAGRCAFADINRKTDTVTIHPDYPTGGTPSIAGVIALSSCKLLTQTEFQAGRAIVLDDVREAVPSLLSSEMVASYEAIGMRSSIIVPFVHGAEPVAFLTVLTPEPRHWTLEEVELMQAVVERTWLTVEVARQHRAEHERANKQTRIAEALSLSLLVRPEALDFEGLEVCTRYDAAADDLLVGGDIYDAFALDGGRVALIVGDATGKGLAASADAADIKFTLRHLLRVDPHADPATALRAMNRHVFDRQRLDRRPRSALLCLSLAVVTPATGEAVLAVAGMESPLILRADLGEVEAVAASGPILGVLSEWGDADTVRTILGPNDVLMLYTDGLSEARPQDTAAFFGTAGMGAALQTARTLPLLDRMAQSVVDGAKRHAGVQIADDCCLLLARRLKPPV